MTIFDTVFSAASRYFKNIAIKTQDLEISYRELYAYICENTARLQKKGFRKGERAMLYLPNSPEFIISFFSVIAAGGVVVLADIKLNSELHSLVEENNVKYIFTDHTGEEKLKNLFQAENNNTSGSFQIIDRKQICTEGYKVSFEDAPETEGIFFEIGPDDPAVILYTSGSTGQPKNVLNSHRTLKEALNNYLNTLDISSDDKMIAVTPFFHSYAMGSCMLAGLASHATLLLRETFHPRQIMALIKTEEATIFHGVPYMYQLMSEHFDPQEHNVGTLRYCISAGAPLNEETAKAFFNLTGKVIHQEYGSSETGTIALNLNMDLGLNIKSVGRTLQGVEVKIIKQSDEGMGLIYIKSRGLSIGYTGKPEFDRDWYETGDLGIVDKDGYLFILGRKKRMINIAGLKVNPNEMEEVLLRHPDVSEALVKGTMHKEFGEIVEAIIVRKNDMLTEDELIRFCQRYVALHKVPKKINWVNEIPKSSLGKTKS